MMMIIIVYKNTVGAVLLNGLKNLLPTVLRRNCSWYEYRKFDF